MADTVHEITTIDERTDVAPPSAGGLINIVEKLLERPDIDLDRVERFLSLQAAEQARIARMQYLAAISAAQPEIPAIPKRGTGNNKVKYARWEDMQEKIFPVTSKHGLNVTHRVRVEGGVVIVTCILSHDGGHQETTELPLPIDGTGSKNAVQAIGSSVSYGKRYTAAALLGVRLEGEDPDGGPPPSEAIDATQADYIRTLLEDADKDEAKWCQYVKIETVEDLPAKKFDDVVAQLRRLIEKRQSAAQTEG